ncbi:MAG: PTS sugar transporter subunit IIC [Clostridia bacterium]
MQKVWEIIKKYAKRYFVDAMSAMALGLFSSLIIGLIISQISKIPCMEFLADFATMASSSAVVGGAIGVAVAYGLKAKPLVMFTSVVTGAFGYSVGGPVGAYLASLVGSEIGGLVSGKTKVDIVVSPIVTILAGCSIAQLMGPSISLLMTSLGEFINTATTLSPIPMGIIIAVVVGLALTAPISSAALCIMLDISGLAAGAATVGCCAQMVGFAVTSFRDNGWGGLISQGVGTSMLQFGNIMKKPAICLAPTLTAAVLGPLSTTIFQMTNNASGAGMGTSGLVGQFGTFSSMADADFGFTLFSVILLHFVLPAILALVFDFGFRKLSWVKDGDMKISL